MYKWKPNNINDPFKTRAGESIADLDKFVEVLKKNSISFSEEQYKEAKKEIKKLS
ncbi:MAG: hypothetical protein E7E64_04940 [Clostridium celatum]|uniref:hypothetical protein n=1 Tax=Clostridium tertium TaxID=1559 RepID=UPI0028FFDB66|nr:hypothetical protein [Clostridium celatum]